MDEFYLKLGMHSQTLTNFSWFSATFLGWDMPLVDLNEWSSFRSLRNPFQVDDLPQTIDNLRTQTNSLVQSLGLLERLAMRTNLGEAHLIAKTIKRVVLGYGIGFLNEA